MILFFVLQGKYDPEGKKDVHCTSCRLVSVDLSIEEERGDIQLFTSEDGKVHWGLGNEETGWWVIKEAYEFFEPTEELHEGKYPVSYRLTEEEFSEIVKEANK
jgi:hypothetical protein